MTSNEEPLLSLGEYSVGMHCDLAKEVMEDTEEPGVSSCERLLKKGRR